jgi:Bacterial archaeo-eukaryotic release factor family 3
MATLTTAQIRTLLTPPATPCVSLYLPTHRTEPDRREDAIRYRKLVQTAGERLRAKQSAAQVQSILRKFHALAEDTGFWSGSKDGLAVLGAGDLFQTHWLPRTVTELAVVADSFHLKPLLRITQSADRFHVLGITRTEVRLFQGDRYGLERVETGGAVPTFDEAVGTELTQTSREKLASGGRTASTGHYSGTGGRKDELDLDTERFLRVIDRAVLDNFSEPTGLPLVVVGLTANLGEFKKLTQNRHVVEDMVPGDPGAFSQEQIREKAWKVIEPRYLARLARLKEDYGTALARKLASPDPAAIAPAAMDGRIGLLLVDADKVVPGRIDRDARTVRTAQSDNPEVDDVLDDLAELVLNTGGEVVVVPSDRMPTDTGVAAVYRF